MSIFDIDWNNDGKLDFVDTAIDCMIIDDIEEDDNEVNFDFDFDDED